MKKLFEIKMKI